MADRATSSSLRVVLRVPPADSPLASASVASVSTSSADEDVSDDQQRPHGDHNKRPLKKKRKSSYHVRKEAMSELRDEEQVLRAQLREVKARAMEEDQGCSLQYALRQNRALQMRVAMNRLAIAGVQSLTSSLGSRLEGPPLGDYIHLPRDPAERRHILQSFKARKLEDAVRFMLARTQSQDLRRRTRQIETFETEEGDHIVLDWGVAKFVQSGLTVKEVYDEMINFAHTHEMTLADKLGVISIRESEICPEAMDVAEVRMVSAHGPRLLIEKNVAVYTHYVARSDLFDQPHGLLVYDFVDQDDLHPYQPLARIRKDISSVSFVMECPSPRIAAQDHQLPEIAIVKWSYGRIHKTHLANEDELEGIAREGAFFDLMVQTIRERLAWKAA